MNVNLTNLSDQFLCVVYKEFLTKRADGQSLQQSAKFKNNFLEKEEFIEKFYLNDISDIIAELKNKNMISVTIGGDFQLQEPAILYMENRFKGKLTEVVDFISKFIP